MNNKYLFGSIIIVVFLTILGYLFTETNIKYEEDFSKIETSKSVIMATGNWVKEKNYILDKQQNTFSFYIKDYKGKEIKVVYKGTIPNNFESSVSVVVTGKYIDGIFYATNILTKCPSKYETEYEGNQKNINEWIKPIIIPTNKRGINIRI